MKHMACFDMMFTSDHCYNVTKFVFLGHRLPLLNFVTSLVVDHFIVQNRFTWMHQCQIQIDIVHINFGLMNM